MASPMTGIQQVTKYVLLLFPISGRSFVIANDFKSFEPYSLSSEKLSV